MKRRFALFVAVIFSLIALTISSPQTNRMAQAQGGGQTCEECQAKVQARFEQCQAVHGTDYTRCYDDFNTGIVHCFRNFCEQ